MSVTILFQDLWDRLLESMSYHRSYENLESNLQYLQHLVDQGVDLNASMGAIQWWNNDTPLYYLIFHVYGRPTPSDMMNQMASPYEQLLEFLLSNGARPTYVELQRAALFPKVFERMLYFAKEGEARLYDYFDKPLCLEIMLGFPHARLDVLDPYQFIDTQSQMWRSFNCLPIEHALMNYARQYGRNSDDKEVIRILKRNGSPPPRLNVMHEILDCIDKKEARERFKEIHELFTS